MARIDVKATVTAPTEINIPLVRGDHHEVSGTFRVFFEIFLSVFSTFLGYVLSLPKVENVQWVMLTGLGIAVLAFLAMSLHYGKKARQI